MPREISDSSLDLSDEGMRRWRAKFARQMFFYALLFIFMSIGVAYMNGLWWDNTIARLATNPFKAVGMLVGQFLILLMLPLMIWTCLQTAWST